MYCFFLYRIGFIDETLDDTLFADIDIYGNNNNDNNNNNNGNNNNNNGNNNNNNCNNNNNNNNRNTEVMGIMEMKRHKPPPTDTVIASQGSMHLSQFCVCCFYNFAVFAILLRICEFVFTIFLRICEKKIKK